MKLAAVTGSDQPPGPCESERSDGILGSNLLFLSS
jgi:hypothetical protein